MAVITQVKSLLLTVFMMRSISIEELSGFRDALLNCVYVLIYRTITIDLCGTGGDGKDTLIFLL
jgi:anthranilate phosphoribosyltransferase